MATVGNNIKQKISTEYYCELCDYITCRKSNITNHYKSIRHILATNGNIIKQSENNNFICEICNKIYKDRTGLWKHKKKCGTNNITQNIAGEKEKDIEKLVNYLMKENAEFKQLIIDQNKQMVDQNKQMVDQNKQMVELAKNAGHNNITNNTTNNNSFNLSLYLNETCKDALNIMDFVNQLQVGTKDLEETGRLGFANGISRIFIDGLKQIDINNRPVHCSDLKREILYIKNNNEWNKEDSERKVLTSAIKHVVNKNIKQIPEWTKVHPDFNNSDSKQNDRYLQIVMESMSGSSQEEANKNYNKIIKNIAKETVIEKEKGVVFLSS
jgi:hypothetical protein